jgi:hypothetical protein
MVFADLGGNSPQRAEDPLKSIMKQKFRARCLERAAKAREEQVRRRRYTSGYPSSEPSSDGFDEAMDDDDEDDDDAAMQGEVRPCLSFCTRVKMVNCMRGVAVFENHGEFR